MSMDFTGASMSMAGGLSAADERPLSSNAQTWAARFGIDLLAAQLLSVPGGLGTSPPDVPLDDQGTSDISEDPSPAEQMLWLGVTLPLPIELRPDDTAAGTEADSVPLVLSDSKLMSRAEWAHWIEVGLAPVGDPREELSADPRSVSIDPVTVDRSTLDPGLRFTLDPMIPTHPAPLTVAHPHVPAAPAPPSLATGSETSALIASTLQTAPRHHPASPHPPNRHPQSAAETRPAEHPYSPSHNASPRDLQRRGISKTSDAYALVECSSPAIISPFSTMDERLLADSSLHDVRLPMGDPTPAQPTVAEEPPSFAAPAPDADNTVTVDRPTGFVFVPPNEVHTIIPRAATQSSHSPRGIPGEPRTELSEVVRQVRTMVTEHETRSTIQLEPAELGRLTLELVNAPEGLKAYVSAEDPAVQRFLERNVQLLESEARLQGVGHMSFSVGANVSGGLGRGDPRQSEAEASFRKNIEWNTAPHAKPRSRRELDTNA